MKKMYVMALVTIAAFATEVNAQKQAEEINFCKENFAGWKAQTVEAKTTVADGVMTFTVSVDHKKDGKGNADGKYLKGWPRIYYNIKPSIDLSKFKELTFEYKVTTTQSTDKKSKIYIYFKSGGRQDRWDNGVFVFQNTAVMPHGKKVASSTTRGIEGAMHYTTTANNILNVGKSIICELRKKIGNRFLNDLCSGKNYNIDFALKATPIKGTPKFISKFGLNRKTGKGIFSQVPDSPGYNRGIKLPNFNSDVLDGKPDIGAHEAGTPPMEFGPKAYLTPDQH